MFDLFPFLFDGDSEIHDVISDMQQEEYDVKFKDFGEYYMIKGYLPGLTAKDVSIDFEKNKAILTIRRNKSYSSNSTFFKTFINIGGNVVKNFYIEEVDVTKIRASFENCRLIITIPKMRIAIEGSNKPLIVDVDHYEIK